jgi:hypothetical protein
VINVLSFIVYVCRAMCPASRNSGRRRNLVKARIQDGSQTVTGHGNSAANDGLCAPVVVGGYNDWLILCAGA